MWKQPLINKWAWLYSHKTLFKDIENFEFHITSTCHKFGFFYFFQPCKNIKCILNSQAIQKQAVGWLWPMARYGLLTPAICHTTFWEMRFSNVFVSNIHLLGLERRMEQILLWALNDWGSCCCAPPSNCVVTICSRLMSCCHVTCLFSCLILAYLQNYTISSFRRDDYYFKISCDV